MLKFLMCDRWSVLDLVVINFALFAALNGKFITALLIIVVGGTILATLEAAIH